ncbi:MAG: DUF2029 domain-containing protein [Nitrospinae bacterium]|nr:DUF2029 domain-containing protein [Nitrospinota bacterium]
MNNSSPPESIDTGAGKGKMGTDRLIGWVFIAAILLLPVLPHFSPLNPYGAYTAYHNGTLMIMSGEDPYPSRLWMDLPAFAIQDRFPYSPTFAFFFYPFALFNNAAGVFAWMFLGAVFFWHGVAFALSKMEGEALVRGKWLFLGAVMMFNETLKSIACLQVNALILGMVLMGVGLFFSRRYVGAAFLLALATNFKIYPVAIALLIMVSLDWRFIGWYLAFLGGAFALPLLVFEPSFYRELLRSWWITISHNTLSPERYLSLEPSLHFFGVGVSGRLFSVFTLANALAIAVAARFVFLRDRNAFIGIVMPIALGFVWLFNNRADNATVVAALPAFVFMLHAFLDARRRGESGVARFHLVSMLAAWWLLSLSYSDLTPKPIRHIAHDYRFMFWGVLAMYFWAWANAIIFARSARAGKAVAPAAR